MRDRLDFSTGRLPTGAARARHRGWVLAAALFGPLAACAPVRQPSVAWMPASTGLSDPTDLIAVTAYAFAERGRLAGHPARAAEMVAALDSLAGVLATDARFYGSAPIAKLELLHARRVVRRVLGIAPGATSAQVVGSMLNLSFALAHGHHAAAAKILRAPIFTFGPSRTLAILSDMPFVRAANIATMDALVALGGGGGNDGSPTGRRN
ncbi:MAG: hypothetical protein ACP5NP_15250 [Acetobacteraceae bacterium]